MPESGPCPSMHCDQGPCRIPSEFIVAAHAEVPPECPNRVRLPDPDSELEAFLNRTDPHVTPRAGLLLSPPPTGGRRRLMASLIDKGRLVLLETRTPIAWRDMPSPRAVREEPPEVPPGPVTEKSWIKIRVVDDASSQPIPNVTMLLTLPNRQERRFTTRADGMIDVQDIDPGSCDVSCSRDDARLAASLDFVAMGESPAEPADEAGGDAQSDVSVPQGTCGLDIQEHQVQTGETLESVAQSVGLAWQELARFNWDTIVPEEIDEHLRDDVGCTQRTADGQNYAFSNSDQPGIIYVPQDWSETGLATEQTHTVRVRKLEYKPAMLECICIPGVTFEFDKSFLRPSVVDHMAPVDDALRRHPDAKLIVWGHTDRVGNDQYNKDLSDRRAKSTYAFITDQPDVWEELYNQENWGLKTVQTVLQDQGHDPGAIDGVMGPDTRRAMRSFKGLPEGAPVQNDAAFRRELFLAYMTGKHDVRVTDDQFAPPKFMGCGEFNPLLPPNAAELANRAPGNEPNRRVVVYLFRTPPRNIPCVLSDVGPCHSEIQKPGDRHGFACAFYDSIAARCQCERRPPKPKPTLTGEATLIVRAVQDGVVVEGAKVKVFGPGDVVRDGETSGGDARFERLAAGSYVINAAKLNKFGVAQTTLGPGEEKTVTVNLDGPEPLGTGRGSLTVLVVLRFADGSTLPALEAVVALAGPTSGQLPAPSGSITFKRLDPGDYTVTGSVVLPGALLVSKQKSVSLGDGETKSVQIEIVVTRLIEEGQRRVRGKGSARASHVSPGDDLRGRTQRDKEREVDQKAEARARVKLAQNIKQLQKEIRDRHQEHDVSFEVGEVIVNTTGKSSTSSFDDGSIPIVVIEFEAKSVASATVRYRVESAGGPR